jgi:hypothetical protein
VKDMIKMVEEVRGMVIKEKFRNIQKNGKR